MTLHHIELQLTIMVEIVNILTSPLGTNFNAGAQNLSLSHGLLSTIALVPWNQVMKLGQRWN